MKIIPRKMVHEVLMKQGKYSARYYFFLDSNSETMHDLGRFIGFRYFNCDWEIISMREYLSCVAEETECYYMMDFEKQMGIFNTSFTSLLYMDEAPESVPLTYLD